MSVATWIGLILTLWKSSVLQPLWAKLPASLQAWMGPLMGIVAAIGSMVANGGSLSWSIIMAGLSTGALGMALHVLLDSIKVLPGIGGIWVTVINYLENFLAAPSEAKSVKGKMSCKL